MQTNTGACPENMCSSKHAAMPNVRTDVLAQCTSKSMIARFMTCPQEIELVRTTCSIQPRTLRPFRPIGARPDGDVPNLQSNWVQCAHLCHNPTSQAEWWHALLYALTCIICMWSSRKLLVDACRFKVRTPSVCQLYKKAFDNNA